MAISDLVMIQFPPEDSLGDKPLLGRVNAEPGGTDANVVWSDGQLSATAVPFATLLKLFTPSTPGVGELVGKYVQLVNWPIPPAANSFAKSPACAGLVIAAFEAADYDVKKATAEIIVMSINDGKGYLTLLAPIGSMSALVVARDGVRDGGSN